LGVGQSLLKRNQAERNGTVFTFLDHSPLTMSESTAAAASMDKTGAVVDIGNSSDFQEGKGRQVDVNGRQVGIFRHSGTLYALDHHCYHSGGPLAMGDIEELVLDDDKTPCVVCPWHGYKISLKTGEGLYIQSDPRKKEGQGQVKSEGRKQRKHTVFEGGDGRVMLKINLTEDVKLASDFYV
jgi:nitrite reductase/ring-hydroxylating ferredoxin subunit